MPFFTLFINFTLAMNLILSKHLKIDAHYDNKWNYLQLAHHFLYIFELLKNI